MAKSHATNITSMRESADEERAARTRKYALMMAVRLACFLALIWVRGPWMLVFAAGAIFLPYFAVVLANAVRYRRNRRIERPGGLLTWLPGSRLGAGDSATRPDHHEHGRAAS